ncbi:MAG: hypothetical protein ABI645_05365 [Pseudomonadota bacterium]
MHSALATALTAGLALALVGCASPDHVLFVTKTSIGIDFDSKPATASLAYDRIEGYVAPSYASGEIPPVVASVKSDGKIFNPAIKQIYATGDAAVIATGGKATSENPQMKGDRKLMFFGTTTTTGVKVGFTTALPDSFVFGFKRKEFSYIPLGKEGTGTDAVDVYPSVLASIDTAANVSATGERSDTALRNSQFFATGKAARLLAASPMIKDGFSSLSRETIQKAQLEVLNANEKVANSINTLVENILASYSDPKTTAAQKKSIVAAAQAAGMDKGGSMTVDNFEKKLTAYSSVADPTEAQKKLQALQEQVDALLAH